MTASSGYKQKCLAGLTGKKRHSERSQAEVGGMFCVHKQVAHGQWVDQCCFKTEFDAYVSAMTKSTETMGTCRVYDSTFQEVTMAFEMGMEIDVGGKETAA
ncbi:hypothetical protein [Synechococcus sp. A15-44]|uniref:hypothetical protein n=1 Tax=Synechococcus sp. A15-44 TaxID=1050646 RepID=UPI0016482BFC|nr:hypothetical protein [Synechococcus sp. A15-44]